MKHTLGYPLDTAYMYTARKGTFIKYALVPPPCFLSLPHNIYYTYSISARGVKRQRNGLNSGRIWIYVLTVTRDCTRFNIIDGKKVMP